MESIEFDDSSIYGISFVKDPPGLAAKVSTTFYPYLLLT